jgi:hypothetical protein
MIDGIFEEALRGLQITRNVAEACDLYKNRLGKYPQNLDQFLQPPDGGRPFLNSGSDIFDQWGHKFFNDSNGPSNNGRRVDIWTIDPNTGKIIGNWSK